MRRFVVAPEAAPLLAEAGLSSFEGLWELALPPLKVKKDREIVRLVLGGEVFFLKRYFRLPFLRASGAEREWEGAHCLRRLGFAVPEPVAFGLERRLLSGRALTLFREAPGVRLEDLFRERGPGEITPMLARLAGRFHALGFSHQDFYLCHLFWNEERGEIVVIDLQRLRRASPPRRRWVVKDLAELFYSAGQVLPPGALRAFKGEFLALYAELVPWAREQSFLAQVEAKVARIARHDRKLRARRRAGAR